MANELMRYIPKEYKELVTNIYEGEKDWNDVTKKWNINIVVEWENGEVSSFQNKSYMRFALNEMHTPDEYRA